MAEHSGALERREGRVSELARRFRLELICFPLVTAVYALHFGVSGYSRFYYDSDEFWRIGDTFDHNGHFSLLSYSWPWRGYSMPLVYHVAHVVGSWFGLGSLTTVKIFGALLAATLGVIVIPRLASAIFPDAAVTPARVLALNALVFLFWRDHFQFPLSDFPALMLGAVAVIALLRGTTRGYVVAGVCLGLAYNIRPNYLAALLVAIAAAALAPRSARTWRSRGTAAATVAVAALVPLLPQMLVNHHSYDTWSPAIEKTHELSLISLYLGLHAQKYETFIGPASAYPSPMVSYLDPSRSMQWTRSASR